MKIRDAYILRTETVIPPFNDHCGEILILNRKLKDHQASLLSQFGIRAHFVSESDIAGRDVAGALVFSDFLYFSAEFLSDFIALSSADGVDVSRAALRKSLFTRQIAILQGLCENESIIEFPLYHVKSGAFDPARAKNVVMQVDEFFESGNFPKHMLGKENFSFCLTTRPITAVRESIHIALANMAANFARVARFKKLSAAEKLRLLFRARSLDRSRLLSALSVVEKGAEVHPTAVVEGSVVRSGAKIGAYAVVRFSVVGNGAFVDDHSSVKFSVIGDGAYIANNNVIFFSVAYPGAFLISGPYHFSCFGYDSAVMNSIPSDYRLDGKTISVMTSSGVRDTGLRFAGSIIGHRTKIAAGLIIAPGRAIPNDLTLYPDPAMVLNRVDTDAASISKVWFLVGGRLVDKP